MSSPFPSTCFEYSLNWHMGVLGLADLGIYSWPAHVYLAILKCREYFVENRGPWRGSHAPSWIIRDLFDLRIY